MGYWVHEYPKITKPRLNEQARFRRGNSQTRDNPRFPKPIIWGFNARLQGRFNLSFNARRLTAGNVNFNGAGYQPRFDCKGINYMFSFYYVSGFSHKDANDEQMNEVNDDVAKKRGMDTSASEEEKVTE